MGPPKCVVFDVARARGGHQTAGLNKSASSIFGSQTANAIPTNPCYCFCILGDPAERLKGIQEQEEADTVRGAGGRMSMVGPSELFDRSGTSTPVRTTTSPSMASSGFGPNAAQQQKGRRDPSRPRPGRTLV